MSGAIERGEFCPKCKNYIPRFLALNEIEVKALRAMRPADAIKELRRKTGCEIVTAKIWVVHPTGPHPARIRPPCPYCGELLFSEKSKQCLKCGWDWHNPEKPIRHSTKSLNETARIAKKKLRWQRIWRARVLKGIAIGEKAIAEGRVLSHEEAKKKLKRWLT